MFDWILGCALIQIPDLLVIAYDYFEKRRISEQACPEVAHSNSHSKLDVASNHSLKLRNSTEQITQSHQISNVVPKEAHYENEAAVELSAEQEIDDILGNEMDRYIATQSN